MSFTDWYLLFSLTTAICAVWELLVPVMNTEKEEMGKIDAETLIYLVFFTMSIILAPLVFLSCIIPSMGDRFKNSLYNGLFPKE
ncbi:hypothetical protein EB001_02905 [bacterium]|nr:hypothetical protein [bacterium]